MKDFFDNDSDSKIPEKLEWQNMEKGILDKMEAMEKAALSKNKGLFFKRSYFLPALLLGVLILGFVLVVQEANHPAKEKKPQVNQQELPEAELLKNKIKKPLNNNELKQDVASKEKENYSKNKVNPNPLAIDKPVTQGTKNRTHQPLVNPNKVTTTKGQPTFKGTTKMPNPANRSQNSQGQKTANEPTKNLTSLAHDKDSSRVNPMNTAPLPKKNDAVTTALDSLSNTRQGPFKNEYLAHGLAQTSNENSGKTEQVDSIDRSLANEIATPLAAEKQAASDEKQASFYARQQLILDGGITFWDAGSGQSLPNKNRYEKPLLSFQIQGNYTRGLRNNFFFMTGFQYQQLESRFEYNTIIPDYVITLQDTVVQVRNNMATGRQEKIYGDVQQTVEAERHIIHYNTTQLFKVSLAAGKTWYLHGLQADFYLGTTFNTLAFNSGRTLVEDVLTDYSGSGSAVIENNFGVDAFVGSRIHYFLDPKIALTAGFQLQKSLTNWSSEENARLRPISIGLQLGLSYNLEKR